MPERRTARENARLEIGPQRGRNSHKIDILGIYDLQGLIYGRTELLVADMRHLEPDPSGDPPLGRCHSTARYGGLGRLCHALALLAQVNGHIQHI